MNEMNVWLQVPTGETPRLTEPVRCSKCGESVALSMSYLEEKSVGVVCPYCAQPIFYLPPDDMLVPSVGVE